MIRVLQIYDSISVSSGISSVIMAWFRNANKESIKMDFLCCWKKEPSYEKEITSKCSKVWYISSYESIGSYYEFILKVKDFFQEHANDYDIIHLHSAIFSFPFLYYARKYGIRVRVVHAHSSSLGNTKLSSVRNILTLIPMKIFGNCFLACSYEAAKVWFESCNIKKYHIILNGIDINEFSIDYDVKKQLREYYNIKADEFLIGHISNMNPIKNIPFLLRVVSELIKSGKKAKIIFIGNDIIPQSIDKIIRELKIENYIINIGIQKDINKLIQMFDVCMMPSISEGYGLVPIEAQAAGVPVIISEGFPKVICFTEACFRLPLKEKKWLECVNNMMNNKLCIVYRKSKLKQFDNAMITENLIKIYEGALNVSNGEIV